MSMDVEGKSILVVANVAKEHINKFHIPTIKVFKENGWSVDVACAGEEEVPECRKQYHMRWKRTPFTFETVRGVFELRKILKENRYDVIYCHTPVGGGIGRLAARPLRKQGMKVVYCAHGLHFFKGASVVNWLTFYPIENILAKFTDIFITINDEDYERVTSQFSKKMRVEQIPGMGISFDRLNIKDKESVREAYRKDLGIGEETTALVYVAELIRNKNQKMLVDAVKILADKGEDICLVLVGPDHENGALKEYAEKKGVKSRIRFLGWRSDIGEILTACDIYTASSIREGFGINLVEAMYCGLPVVASLNRGHSAAIKDGINGFLVKTGDAAAMADRVDLLIHNRETREKLSHVDVSGYNCRAVAEMLFEMITEAPCTEKVTV